MNWIKGRKQPASDGLTPPPAKTGRTGAQPGVPLELVKYAVPHDQADRPQLPSLKALMFACRYDTETGKFTVGSDAVRVLRSAKDPIGVVAVCGRARQGKSFILNQLLGQSTGFQVRSGGLLFTAQHVIGPA